MNKQTITLFCLLFFGAVLNAQIIISGVFDAQPGAAGTKGIELYATEAIPDLSIFGVGSANNGDGTDGEEFTFPAAAAAAGDCIYVVNDSTKFADFFGFPPNFVDGAANINGDDAIELFKNGQVIDVFGDINVDGSGEPWEYLDGWTYRSSGTGPDGTTFVLGNWTFSGIDGLQGFPTNAMAPVPFPTCTYSPTAATSATANDDNATTELEMATNINVLGNDALPNPLISLTIIDQAANGTAVANGIIDVTYTPNTGFCGSADVFTYEICDAIGCDTAAVNVTVNCPPSFPPHDIGSVTTVDADGLPDSLGVTCQLQGIVHGIDLQGSDAIQFVFIDATGGISLFSGNNFGYTVTEGDEVVVQGTISQFNCLTQITPDTLWMVSAGNPTVTPTVVTTLDESGESELIRINGVSLVDPAQWDPSGSGFNVDITDGMNTFAMRIDNDVDLFGFPAPLGTFDLVGLGGQFDFSTPCDEGYQILPRSSADLLPHTPLVPNDACVDAIEVFLPDTVEFSTIGATWEGPFHLNAPCPSSESDSIFSDIWYVHTATITGSLKWTLCGMADFDSRIAVYKGNATCPLTDDDLLACNEDGPGACTNSESELNFPVTEGETYLLRLGGFGAMSPGAQGSGSFILEALPEGPPNDFCENAASVTVGSGQVFTTIAAITDGPGHPNDPTCFGFGDIFVNSDIWYEYTADFTGSLEWSTCDAGQINFDSRLAVYGPNATCPVAVEDLLACNDDGSGCPDFHSKVIFDVEEGNTYLLRLGSFGGDQGQGTFDLNEITPPEPPANDLCINADTSWIITAEEADNFDVVFDGTTVNGSFDPDTFFMANTRCFNNVTSGEFSEVWFEFNSLGNSEIQVRLNAVDPTTEFSFDLFQDCGVPIDTNVIFGPCIATATDMPSVSAILTGFPPEPTHYIARITTRLTSQLPGDFFFQLVGDIVTDAKEVAFPGSIALHPNPVKDYLLLNLNMREPAQTSIEIMNTLGQVVYSEGQTNLPTGANHFEFDVSGFANGLYFVVVTAGDGRKSLRFVKD